MHPQWEKNSFSLSHRKWFRILSYERCFSITTKSKLHISLSRTAFQAVLVFANTRLCSCTTRATIFVVFHLWPVIEFCCIFLKDPHWYGRRTCYGLAGPVSTLKGLQEITDIQYWAEETSQGRHYLLRHCGNDEDQRVLLSVCVCYSNTRRKLV